MKSKLKKQYLFAIEILCNSLKVVTLNTSKNTKLFKGIVCLSM